MRLFKLPGLFLLLLPHLTSTAQEHHIKSDSIRIELLQFSKTYLDAYNACDSKKTIDLLSDDVEFYHDVIGMVKGKSDVYNMIEAVCKRNNYDWVKAKLVGEQKTFELWDKGKLYGAIMTGDLLFYEFDKKTGKQIDESTSSFIWVMQYKDGHWTVKRDLSYNHQDMALKK